MSEVFNIYCDESCHLENDRQSIMVLGALSCPAAAVRSTALEIRALKRKHRLEDSFEIKWGKVSPSKTEFYLEIIDFFFDRDFLSFRALVIPNKSDICHKNFGQTHNQWYYKMYYLLLRPLLKKAGLSNQAFLDIKDTQGGPMIAQLESYLSTHLQDEKGERLVGMQLVHSKEVSLVQLADLLIGALSYVHRGLKASAAKTALIERIKLKSGLTLQWSTAPGRQKFDVFVWEANQGDI